jgi:hypothetical protein
MEKCDELKVRAQLFALHRASHQMSTKEGADADRRDAFTSWGRIGRSRSRPRPRDH